MSSHWPMVIGLAILIFGIRIGLRLLFRAGVDAVTGGPGEGPVTPSCPYCSSASVTQAGGHWDCRSCGQMF